MKTIPEGKQTMRLGTERLYKRSARCKEIRNSANGSNVCQVALHATILPICRLYILLHLVTYCHAIGDISNTMPLCSQQVCSGTVLQNGKISPSDIHNRFIKITTCQFDFKQMRNKSAVSYNKPIVGSVLIVVWQKR